MKRRIAKKIVSKLGGRRLKWRRRTVYQAADMILGPILAAEDIDDIIYGRSLYFPKGILTVRDGVGKSVKMKFWHGTMRRSRARIEPIINLPPDEVTIEMKYEPGNYEQLLSRLERNPQDEAGSAGTRFEEHDVVGGLQSGGEAA